MPLTGAGSGWDNAGMENEGNLIQTTTELALHMVRGYARPGMTAVDATCGNGHDTLALARMEPARLFAFDVQPAAVEATERLLGENGFGARLADGTFTAACLGHEEMGAFLRDAKATPDIIVFNLGYLPGGDKALTTTAETTLPAVEQALELLAEDGLICVTMYSGHDAGKKEKAALLAFAEELDSRLWHTAYIQMRNQKNDPPEILLITRKRANRSAAR